jgi:hypothetical protein
MTTFRLEKQSAGKTSTRFHVVDGSGSICGIITVANEAVSDLQKHWKDVPPSSPKTANAAKQNNPMIAAMVKASKERGSMNRQAVLRGC